MLRLLARFWARQKYIFELEVSASRELINARLAENKALERRSRVATFRKDADAIEQSIKDYEAKEEKGFWLRVRD